MTLPRHQKMVCVPEANSSGMKPSSRKGRICGRQIGVDDLVDVGEGVVAVPDALVVVRAVHAHAVAEQAVAADVPEADVALEQGEGVLVVAAQGEFDAAGADAVPPGVGEAAGRLGGDADHPFSLHPFSFLKRSRALLCRPTS